MSDQRKYFTEISLWIVVEALICLPFMPRMIAEVFFARRSSWQGIVELMLLDHAAEVFLLFAVPFFLIMYYQIYHDLPLNSLITRSRVVATELKPASDLSKTAIQAEIDRTSHALLALYVQKSREVSQTVLRRSGTFILSGVSVAFCGLAAFYFLHRQAPTATDPLEHVLLVLPSFGILFFIEYVAFFLLRQYRIGQNEFRYFELIARSRENTLLALKLGYERGDTSNTSDIISACKLFAGPDRLGKDESTEFIEALKLQKDDIVLFEKFLDLASVLRTREPEDKKK